MFTAAPLSYWIGFHLIVAVLLLVDLVVLQRSGQVPSQRVAWGWTSFVAALAGCFALWLAYRLGRQPALEFTSGYLIEGSLSVDNLFVFLLMFRALGLSREEQRRALLWGVCGAILMRAIFISLGVALLTRFEWIQYVFGAVLLVAAIRLMRPGHGNKEPSKLMGWLRGKHSASGGPGHQSSAAIATSSLLFVILAIEVTDLVFALDSIPAVLAVTRNPFLAYTSNIFAILGLRSLFFALSHLLDKLRLLHYGLAVILAFVALKMLLARWLEVPVSISLTVILAVLAIFTVASLSKTKSHHLPTRN